MKRANKRKRLVFELTVSGLSASLVLIMLVLANYSPVGTLSFFVLSGIALLLPCVINSIWGLCMSFIAGGALALLFNPVNVVPFAFFFGPQVILMYICKRYLKDKWYISLPLKAILLEVGIFGIYKLYGIDYIEQFFSAIGVTYNYWFVLLITVPLLLLYDYCMGFIWRFLNRRLEKVVVKYTDKVKPNSSNNNGNSADSGSVIDGGSHSENDSHTDSESSADNEDQADNDDSIFDD